MSNIAPIEQLSAARNHIAFCRICGGASVESDQSVREQISRRSDRSILGRTFLGLLGAVQLLLALPWLFGSTVLWSASHGTEASHLSRDGAIGFMFATIALAVAASPRLAVFALPIALLLLTLQAVTGFVDHVNSNVLASFETIHMLGAVIGASIAVLSFPKRTKRRETTVQLLNKS